MRTNTLTHTHTHTHTHTLTGNGLEQSTDVEDAFPQAALEAQRENGHARHAAQHQRSRRHILTGGGQKSLDQRIGDACERGINSSNGFH